MIWRWPVVILLCISEPSSYALHYIYTKDDPENAKTLTHLNRPNLLSE